MANERLDGMNVAILATEGFEQVELTEPRKALDAAGATTTIVSPHGPTIRGFKHHDPADAVNVDATLDRVQPDAFDALVLPGGVMNPDALRMDPRAVAFVRAFADARKPIAVICHGPWTLIEADAVRGRRIASWPSLKTDLRNAGATYVDEPNVVDGNITSSRKPDDLPAFNRSMIELFARSRQAAPAASLSG